MRYTVVRTAVQREIPRCTTVLYFSRYPPLILSIYRLVYMDSRAYPGADPEIFAGVGPQFGEGMGVLPQENFKCLIAVDAISCHILYFLLRAGVGPDPVVVFNVFSITT